MGVREWGEGGRDGGGERQNRAGGVGIGDALVAAIRLNGNMQSLP